MPWPGLRRVKKRGAKDELWKHGSAKHCLRVIATRTWLDAEGQRLRALEFGGVPVKEVL